MYVAGVLGMSHLHPSLELPPFRTFSTRTSSKPLSQEGAVGSAEGFICSFRSTVSAHAVGFLLFFPSHPSVWSGQLVHPLLIASTDN